MNKSPRRMGFVRNTGVKKHLNTAEKHFLEYATGCSLNFSGKREGALLFEHIRHKTLQMYKGDLKTVLLFWCGQCLRLGLVGNV